MKRHSWLWSIATAASLAAMHAAGITYDFLPASITGTTGKFNSLNGNGFITATTAGGPFLGFNNTVYPSQFTNLFPASGTVTGYLAQADNNAHYTVTFDLTNYAISSALVFGIWNITEETNTYSIQLLDSSNFPIAPPFPWNFLGYDDDALSGNIGWYHMNLNPATGIFSPFQFKGAGIDCDAAFWNYMPSNTAKIVITGTLGPANADGVVFYYAEPRTNACQILCPPNKTVSVCAGSAAVTFPSPKLLGPCGSNVTAICNPPSGFSFPLGTNTVTCTAVNGPQIIDSCSFTVMVVSNCPAVLVDCNCLTNLAVLQTNACQAIIPDLCQFSQCWLSPLPLTCSQSPIAGTVVGPGNYPITVTYSDGFGGTQQCLVNFSVTALPDCAPWSVDCNCLANLSALQTNACQAVIPNLCLLASNCILSTVQPPLPLTCNQTPLAGTVVGIGNYQITVTFSDSNGVTQQCLVHFTVTPPAGSFGLICASNKSVNCGSSWTFDPPTSFDNCCPMPTTVTVAITTTNGTNPVIITRTWQATNGCGLAATCSQTVTILGGNCCCDFVNGDFSQSVPVNGSGGGWTSSGLFAGAGWQPNGGNPGGTFLLNNVGDPATDPTISQTLCCLTPGQCYMITGERMVQAWFGETNDSFAVLLDGVPIRTLPVPNNPPDTNWHPFSVSFTATNPCQTISIAAEYAGTDVSYWVDNIHLQCCTNPCAGPRVLYNLFSGRDTNGSLLAANAFDPQFSTGGGLWTSSNPYVNGTPSSYWIANGPNSQWVGPGTNQIWPAGVYPFTNVFYLDCTNQASISGIWSMDDAASIWLNGLPSGVSVSSLAPFGSWHPVNITSGFVAGLNTLVFYVTNVAAFSPTGLRTELAIIGKDATCCNPGPCVGCPPLDQSAIGCPPRVPDFSTNSFAGTNCTPPGPLVVTQSIPAGTPLPVGQTNVTVHVCDALGNCHDCVIVINAIASPGCCSTVAHTLLSGHNAVGLQPIGALDLQFAAVGVPFTTPNPYVITPTSGWLANGPDSRWIGPDTNSGALPIGVYVYSNRFFLCSTNQAAINGQWTVDDSAMMSLNGAAAGPTITAASAYSSWWPINLTSGFVPGWNSLLCYVTNYQGPTGLRVELTNSACCNNCVTLDCSTNRIVGTCGSTAQVLYSAPAASSTCAGLVSILCVPTSGSNFPLGTNVVQCTAIDGLGNAGTCSFTVTVLPALPSFCAPNLQLNLSGTTITLSWPDTANGFELREAISLAPPVSWSVLTNPIIVLNGRYQVTLPVQHPTRFYQLRTP